MSGNVRFIRVNGRVVPIKDKGPSKAQREKNYKKHGDGGRQSGNIDAKYDKKANKGTLTFDLVAAAGLLGAAALKGKAAVAAGVIGATSAIAGAAKRSRQAKKHAFAREKEYVRAFGMTSDGQKPFSKRRGK